MKEISLITGRGLARLLECDYTTILRWKAEGRIKPIGRLGNCDVFDIRIVEKLKRETEKISDKRCKRIGGITNYFSRGLVVPLKEWRIEKK